MAAKRTQASGPRAVFAAMGLGAIAIGLPWSAAIAQADAACSASYHAALGELLARRGEDLGAAVTTLRAADPTLPGRWLYSQALFPPKKGRPAEPPRVCAEQVKVAGRLRCVKYEEAAALSQPTELAITPNPNAEELRVLKALNDLVEARGGAPEVSANGRYVWLAQRAAGDLKTYMVQPSHPALCSGGKEFAEFYGNTMRPLQKRIDDVGELSRKARALALIRIAEATAEATLVEGAPVAQRRPAETPLLALVADAIRAAVPEPAAQEVAAERTALAALRRAKSTLITAQIAAQQPDADPKTQERVLAAGRAVRMLEAAAYGEIYVARFAKFSADAMALPAEIQRTHAAKCTCGS